MLLLLTLLASGPPAIDVARLPPDAAADVGPALAAAAAAPADLTAVGRLAIVLHAWEQWQPALDVYARARALAPDDPQWPYLAGLAETARAGHAAAADHFRRALARDPTSPLIRLRLAEAELASGDLDASAPRFAALAAIAETAPAAEYGLARIAAASGRDADAVRHFQRALDIHPQFGAAWYGLAQSLRRLGRRDEARDAIANQRACPACWPLTPDPWRARVDEVRVDAQAQLARGLALAEEGDVDGAIQVHLALLERAPATSQAHVNLIALLGRQQRWQDAEAHYRLAVAGDANPADAHAAFGEVLFAARRYREAGAAFAQALDVNPHSGGAANGLGLALEASGDRAGALAAYRRAVDAAPALRAARFNLARLLMTGGSVDAAVAELERIQSPEDAETPRYRFALAAALVARGAPDEGRQRGEEALALARRFGQHALAADIARDLARLARR